MFKAYFKLPDEVGRQKPRNIFYVINHLDGEEKPDYDDIPPMYRAFYGL